MKNLKKVLSLALAFAMVLGLCIGASAADVTTLNDWDEVENKSAATLLGAFDIMKGDDEGNFRPNDNVTRAETAKMISVALWGGSDDVALYNAGNIGGYTDVVAGAWYMGYVNYMTVQSIVTGKGDGIFDPNGNVTGYELLKMCLVSLGYSPETEGMTGAGWDVRTMALATKPGFQNLTANTTVTNWNAPLTRTNAAQIIANMIYRETVYYSLQSGVGGNVTSRVVGNGKTFAESVLGMTQRVGTIDANEYGMVADFNKFIDKDGRNYNGENTVVTFPEIKDADGKTIAKALTVSIELTSTAADVGGKVAAFIVDGKVVSASLVPTEEIAPKVKKIGEDASAKYVIDNVDRDSSNAAKVTYYLNGVKQDVDEATDAKLFVKVFENVVALTQKNDAFVTKANAEIKYLDTNGDGYIDTVKGFNFGTPVEVTKDDAKKTEAGDSYIVGTNTKLVKAECDFEAAKGDFVSYVAMPNGNVFSKDAKSNHGYVMDSIEGKVTRISVKNSENVSETLYIDGVKYANTYATAADKTMLGAEGTFFFLADGKTVGAFKGTQTVDPTTYALIFDAGIDTTGNSAALGGSTNSVVEVSAVLPDGSTKNYVVKTIVNAAGEPKAAAELYATVLESAHNAASAVDTEDSDNLLMKYALNDDGTLTLYQDGTGDAQKVKTDIATDVKFTKDTAAASNGTLISNEAVTYIQTEFKATGDTSATGKITSEKWVAYKGLTAPSYTTKKANAGQYVLNNSGAYSYIAMSAADQDPYTAPTTGFYYVLTDAAQIMDTDGKTVVNVVDAFNSETGKVEQMTYATSVTTSFKGKIYTDFTKEAGFASEATGDKGLVTNVGGGILRIAQFEETGADDAKKITEVADSGKVFTVNNDTKYYIIDGEDSKTAAAGDVAVSTVEVGKYDTFVMTAASDTATVKTATAVIIFATAQDA